MKLGNKIEYFFRENIEIVAGCLKLNDMIESPVILIEELETSIKDCSIKWQIINLYTKECNLIDHAYARDIEIINYLVDFVRAGYDIGTRIFPVNTDIDTVANDIQIISNKSIECKSFQSLSLSQKRIIKVVNIMTTCEIIKGIKDIKVKKSL